MKQLESLYAKLPIFLQDVAVTLQGANYWRQRYGAAFLEEHRFLKSAEQAAPLQLELLSNARLKRILSFAGTRVPAYRERISSRLVQDLRAGNWQALQEIPVTEKTDLRSRPTEYLDGGTIQADWIQWNTSGTTGSPMQIYYTAESVQRQYAFVERYREQAGVNRFRRRAQFTGKLVVPNNSSERYWRYDWANSSLMLSTVHLTRSTIPTYLEALRRFRPEYLTGYPSAIALLADCARQNRVPIRLRAVLTSAETLSQRQRSAIEDGFGTKVYDQYGQTEMQSFWSECRYGRMHANSLFGVTEILRPNGDACSPGEVGDVVLTGFLNYAMPLIRYRVGDRAAWSEECRCPCGSNFPIISHIEGRRDDYLFSYERGWVGRMDPVLKGVQGLIECQLIQDAPNHLEVLIVPSEQFTASDRLQLERNLQARLGSLMQLEFRTLDRIPRGPNGKFRAVINRLGREFQPDIVSEEVA